MILVTFSANAETQFAVIGDFGDGSANEEGKVAALVHSWNPEFVLALGDNRYGSINYDTAVGQFYCDYLSGAEAGASCSGNMATSNAFFPVPGNHDYNNGGGLPEYLAYFDLPGAGAVSSYTSGNERYYDFTKGVVQFFMIDSEGALDDEADMVKQMAWLRAGLAASSARWKIVVFHHPPYSSGKHGSEAEMQWDFKGLGADVVLSGHEHDYERLTENGLTYIVNGLGGKSIRDFNTPVAGSELRYNGDYGAMLVAASEKSLTFKFFNTVAQKVDSYTLGEQPLAPAIPWWLLFSD